MQKADRPGWMTMRTNFIAKTVTFSNTGSIRLGMVREACAVSDTIGKLSNSLIILKRKSKETIFRSKIW